MGKLPLIKVNMEKRFPEWIQLKKELHESNKDAHLVSEGEIWWASVGENIGLEISGKSKYFSRPVVILKKLSRNFYLVIPTTSQIRKGTWYVNFTSKIIKTACLHQVRTIDDRRLHSRMGILSRIDFKHLKDRFLQLYQ